MKLEIRAFGNLNKLVPQGPTEFEGPLSLEALLTHLAERCGPEFERQIFDGKARVLNTSICITLNGRIVTEPNLKKQLEENDRIAVFTFLAGG